MQHRRGGDKRIIAPMPEITRKSDPGGSSLYRPLLTRRRRKMGDCAVMGTLKVCTGAVPVSVIGVHEPGVRFGLHFAP